MEQVIINLNKPKNHLALLCHGDFNRNNLLFYYNKSSKLQSMKIIDFQGVHYAQPSLDLAIFFGLSVTKEDLHEHFNLYFQIYHNSIIETLRNYSTTPIDYQQYSIEKFLTDYAEQCWLGYFVGTYLMPVFEKPELRESWSLGTQSSWGNVSSYMEQWGDRTKMLSQLGYFASHCIDLNQKWCN